MASRKKQKNKTGWVFCFHFSKRWVLTFHSSHSCNHSFPCLLLHSCSPSHFKTTHFILMWGSISPSLSFLALFFIFKHFQLKPVHLKVWRWFQRTAWHRITLLSDQRISIRSGYICRARHFYWTVNNLSILSVNSLSFLNIYMFTCPHGCVCLFKTKDSSLKKSYFPFLGVRDANNQMMFIILQNAIHTIKNKDKKSFKQQTYSVKTISVIRSSQWLKFKYNVSKIGWILI